MSKQPLRDRSPQFYAHFDAIRDKISKDVAPPLEHVLIYSGEANTMAAKGRLRVFRSREMANANAKRVYRRKWKRAERQAWKRKLADLDLQEELEYLELFRV